jgi:hypothetical protein
MNLILGILWLGIAIAIFAHDYSTGEVRWRIVGLNISLGWVVLLLAAYNFVRWYGQRAMREDQEAIRLAHEARHRHVPRREREPREPDPTFDFGDKPPKEEPK